MEFGQVVKHYGGLTAAAAALGAPVSTVSDWRYTGVPFGRQCEIELLTRGKLKATRKRRRRA